MTSRSLLAAFVAIGVLAGSPAAAQDTIKIAYIDPLSGPGATVGEVGLKTFQFLAEELNAKGGAAGKKFEILPRDLSQQEGELTPTLKVKRNVVADKYAGEIESLYSS